MSHLELVLHIEPLPLNIGVLLLEGVAPSLSTIGLLLGFLCDVRALAVLGIGSVVGNLYPSAWSSVTVAVPSVLSGNEGVEGRARLCLTTEPTRSTLSPPAMVIHELLGQILPSGGTRKSFGNIIDPTLYTARCVDRMYGSSCWI